MDQVSGFGCNNFNFAVYIGNRPNMGEYNDLVDIKALTKGEISAINEACGNGWRKVFNVYAKVLFALDLTLFPYQKIEKTWQHYRDKHLLQKGSKTALLFTTPRLNKSKSNVDSNCIHIICGKTYAKHLLNLEQLTAQFTWLDDEFAVDKKNRVVVCPYFDYRQLSNSKIEKLAVLIKEMK